MWDVGVGFGSGILIVYKCDLARDLLGEKQINTIIRYVQASTRMTAGSQAKDHRVGLQQKNEKKKEKAKMGQKHDGFV